MNKQQQKYQNLANESSLDRYVRKLDNNVELKHQIFKYYRLRIDIEKLLNARSSKEEYQKLYQNESDDNNDFTNTVAELRKLLGLEDIFYCVANQVKNGVHIFKNRDIDERHKNVLLLLLDPSLYAKEDIDNQKNKELLDLLYEAEEDFISLRPTHTKKDYTSPYFLQNLPPFLSKEAIPVLPFEERWRKKLLVNYLYVYTGEVAFFLYTYCYIIDCVRFLAPEEKNGTSFSNLFRPDFVNIPNQRKKPFQLWKYEVWAEAGFKDIPELRWLTVAERLQNYQPYEGTNDKRQNEKFSNLIQLWNNNIEQHEVVDPEQKDFDFIKERWPQLGLAGNVQQKHDKRVKISLLSYCFHVLLKSNFLPSFGMVEYETFSSSFHDTIDQDFLQEVMEVTNEDKPDEKKIKDWIDKKVDDDKFVHFIVLTAAYQVFAQKLNQQKDRTLGNILRQVQRKVRFTLFQSYFQSVWQPYSMPVEHYYFPVHKSLKYKSSTYLGEENDPSNKSIVKKTPFVVVACAVLKPIWQVGSNFNITSNKDYFLFEREPEISFETITRLNLISDFVRLMSISFVDDYFYGNIVQENTENKIETDRYETYVHEVKGVIEKISSKTRDFVLEDIRLYFNVIFQQAEWVMNEMKEGRAGDTIPEEFNVANTYKKMLKNAAKLAAKIHAPTKTQMKVEDGEFKVYSKKEYKREIQKLKDDVKVKVKGEIPKVILDDYKIYVYFLMAFVCGIRNAFKHYKQGTKIRIREYDSKYVRKELGPCFIIVNEHRPSNTKPAYKIGGTATSLFYYINRYKELNNEIGIDIDNAKETLLKINPENPQEHFTFIPKIQVR